MDECNWVFVCGDLVRSTLNGSSVVMIFVALCVVGVSKFMKSIMQNMIREHWFVVGF